MRYCYFAVPPFIETDAYLSHGGTYRLTVFAAVFSRLAVSRIRKAFPQGIRGRNLTEASRFEVD